MDNTNSKGIWEWALVGTIIGLSLILFAGFIFYEGFTEEGVRQIIRYSARISVTCFCIAFGGKYIHQRMQSSFSFWLYMNRKYWGITFAIVHLLHLTALGVLQYFFHPVFELAAGYALAAGGTAYLFIVLMLLTSFDVFAKRLSGKQWRLLHTIGGYWILGIFFNSYRKGLMRGEYWDLVWLVMLVGVLVLRLLKKIKV